VRLSGLQQLTNLAQALQSGNSLSPEVQCFLVARIEFQDLGSQHRNILKPALLKCCAQLFQYLGNALKFLQLLLRTILELLQLLVVRRQLQALVGFFPTPFPFALRRLVPGFSKQLLNLLNPLPFTADLVLQPRSGTMRCIGGQKLV
jgi:hypothetical protein